MLNKFIKTINNKYSRIFRFIFFLKYLFSIFFISIALFLFIPSFFNYDKKSEVIQQHLFDVYNFKTKKYDKITYHPFPFPNLKFKNTTLLLGKSKTELDVENLILFPKLLNIFNYQNLETNKIILRNSNTNLDTTDLKLFFSDIFNQTNKFSLINLNLNIFDKNKSLVKIEKINFGNYGHKKNLIHGNIFNKKFKIDFKDSNKNFKIKLINSGVYAEINLNNDHKDSSISGTSKFKILNTNLRFNFDYDYKKLTIYNSFFRSKNLSFKNESNFIFEPYLDLNSKFFIEEIDTQILKKLNYIKLFKIKKMLKKINSKNDFYFKSNKLNHNLIDEMSLKIDLAYGNMNFVKNSSFSGNDFKCEGSINFLEEFPLLYFDCSLISDNKKKLFRKFSIKIPKKDKTFQLFAKGNFSILNKKINLKNVTTNNNYKASKEDLKYYDTVFEKIFLSESFVEILNKKKIKEFVLEVY